MNRRIPDIMTLHKVSPGGGGAADQGGLRRARLGAGACALALGFVALVGLSPLPADEEAEGKAATGAESPETREEKIRIHGEKVKAVLEEKRRARMEQQKRLEEAREEKPLPNAMEEGAPVPGPAVPGAPMAAPGGPPQAAPPAAVSSGTLLYLTFYNPLNRRHEFDTIVTQHEKFAGSVEMINDPPAPIDRLRIVLDYDKRFVRPLKVLDSRLRPRAAEPPRFSVSEREGRISYDVQLKEPLREKEGVLLDIVWEALQPTAGSPVSFHFADDETETEAHTGAYVHGHNTLGTPSDPVDGVLGGTIEVAKTTARSGREKPMQGKATELQTSALGVVASKAKAGLTLVPPKEDVRSGDEFIVRVALNNPEGAVIDSVRFTVSFDPHVLRVLDRDKGNAMKRGVNLHDAPYRKEFPWDFHKENEVDNERGLINYSMAIGASRSFESDPFADIHFLALGPTDATELAFVQSRSGAGDLTRLLNFGYNLLDLSPRHSVASVKLAIHPEDYTGQAGKTVTQAELDHQLLSISAVLSQPSPPPRETSFQPPGAY